MTSLGIQEDLEFVANNMILVYNLGVFSGLSTEIFEKIVSSGDLTLNRMHVKHEL